MKIITSVKTEKFNAVIDSTTERLIGINRLAKKIGTPDYIDATKYQFGYVCGIYMSLFDISPGSVKYEEKSLCETIRDVISKKVSENYDAEITQVYFDFKGIHSDQSCYIKAATDEYRFNNFLKQIFRNASVLVTGFSQGYIAGIAALCEDYGISFKKPNSETNTVLKNWKFFFSSDKKNEFRIDGKFFWGPKAMIEESINDDVYSSLKKLSQYDFKKKIEIVDLKNFL